MRQLESHQQVVGCAEIFTVSVDEFIVQPRQPVFGLLVDDELVGVRAGVVLDGHGFAAPDPLGSAAAEVAPAPPDQFAGAAVFLAVPAFHGVDHPAVAHAKGANMKAANIERPRQR